jgi:hypothetical protein
MKKWRLASQLCILLVRACIINLCIRVQYYAVELEITAYVVVRMRNPWHYLHLGTVLIFCITPHSLTRSGQMLQDDLP